MMNSEPVACTALAEPGTKTAALESRPTPHDLAAIFEPRSVALVGASERGGSVGATILRNLATPELAGRVFPINPKRDSVLGMRAYPSLAALPASVDLAVIATPAATVPGVIGDCVAAGIPGAVIISAGFKEKGAAGAALEQQIAEIARGKLRIVGPNCLGVMNPRLGLNATFAHDIALPGHVAFLSQSGALCTAILDWSRRELVGFSGFASTGSMLDVGWGDLIDYFGDDPHTRSIVVYMESIGDASSFLSAAREVTRSKPIIVVKAGRTEAAARAAASHTGALTGSDDVLEAAFRRCGVLRVNSIAELFYMTEVLAKQPRPRGRRLMIVTNAGGPGVLATDRLIADGGELAVPSSETIAALNEFLPDHWSHNNPIDVLGDADPQRYAKAFQIAARDSHCDGVLAIMSPQGMTQPAETAAALAKCTLPSKPVLASWMGADQVSEAVHILNQASIPTFSFPDTAASAFVNMWRYQDNLRALYETPTLSARAQEDRQRGEGIIRGALQRGRTLLTEVEAKELLASYGIPVVPTRTAKTEDEAVTAADAIGYPVVVKLWSETITHKTDVGGVELNLEDADALRAAFRRIRTAVEQKASAADFVGVTVQPMIEISGYELIVGSALDAQFGPVLLSGAGGQLVEVMRDRAVGLPPLTRTLARRLLERTKIYTALAGARGRKAVNLTALEDILVRFSELIVQQPWIREIEINPLLASPEALVALDARAVLHDPATKEADLPRPAIRPYPAQYITTYPLRSGGQITLRPIRPEDEPLMVGFHGALSERTTYLRYFQVLQLDRRVAHERLSRLCFIDYDRQMALVAERQNPQTGESEIVGVGRLSKLHGTNDAELAVVIADEWQRLGIGRALSRRLLDVARNEKIARVVAYYLPENIGMRSICQKLGMSFVSATGASPVTAALVL
jgi:acetyltransferase